MKLTIGIPFYNAEATLADTIRSVFAQTFQDWELLLVDDGSTDRSLDIAKSVKDDRVRVISDGVNRKVAYRHNQITANANGIYVGRLDSDDLISPFRFEKQVAILDEFPNIDVVSTHYCAIIGENYPIGKGGHNRDKYIPIVLHGSMTCRKEWCIKNPYNPDVAYAEDSEMLLQAYYRGQFSSRNVRIINEPLYYYRFDNAITAEKKIKGLRALRRRLIENSFNTSGYWFICKEYFKSFLKEAVVRFFDMIGKMNYFAKSRLVAMTPNEIETVGKDIKTIRETKVAGLD